MASDDNWIVVILKLIKAQKRWAQMLRILGCEGGNTQVSRLFYKSVVQAILLCKSETLVLIPWMVRTPRSFYLRVIVF